MGYISIQINKAKGSADTGASDHIERKTIPKKADLTNGVMTTCNGCTIPSARKIQFRQSYTWMSTHRTFMPRSYR